jgi:hypothetical protein
MVAPEFKSAIFIEHDIARFPVRALIRRGLAGM